MFKLILILFSSSVLSNAIIINPHFGHSLSAELNSNLFEDNKHNLQGLTSGVKLLYRHNIFFYGIDYERSTFRVSGVDATNGFSSQKLSGVFGARISNNDYFVKVTGYGEASLDNLGVFSRPLGFEAGYIRRFVVDSVTKLTVFATFSRIDWQDYSRDTADSSYNLEIKRLHIGVGIPFEIEI